MVWLFESLGRGIQTQIRFAFEGMPDSLAANVASTVRTVAASVERGIRSRKTNSVAGLDIRMAVCLSGEGDSRRRGRFDRLPDPDEREWLPLAIKFIRRSFSG